MRLPIRSQAVSLPPAPLSDLPPPLRLGDTERLRPRGERDLGDLDLLRDHERDRDLLRERLVLVPDEEEPPDVLVLRLHHKESGVLTFLFYFAIFLRHPNSILFSRSNKTSYLLLLRLRLLLGDLLLSEPITFKFDYFNPVTLDGMMVLICKLLL